MTVPEWATAEHALAYLAQADSIPHRAEGEAVLLDLLPRDVRRVLDLGTGDGRLLALVKLARPGARAVALDFSPAMLDAARARFAGDASVEIVAHDLEAPLPDLGRFDAVVSSFVLCSVAAQAPVLAEMRRVLKPRGRLVLLEHVRGEGNVARWQDRLAPLHRRLAGNCHLNRDTGAAVAAAGFDVAAVRPTHLPGTHKLVRPGIQGTAIKTSS